MSLSITASTPCSRPASISYNRDASPSSAYHQRATLYQRFDCLYLLDSHGPGGRHYATLAFAAVIADSIAKLPHLGGFSAV